MNEIIVIESQATKELWEKLDDEGAKQFSAFKTYRDLPPHQRSLIKAVRKLFGDDAGVSKLRVFQTWSSKYHWVSRAMAWDEEQDREFRQAQINAIKSMKDRHVQIAKALQQKAIERLKELDAAELSPGLILQFINLGSSLERLSLGEPTNISETTNKNSNINLDVNFSELTDDQLREILIRKQLTE